MLNDTSVASAGSYIRMYKNPNSKKIATIRDFHQNICVNFYTVKHFVENVMVKHLIRFQLYIDGNRVSWHRCKLEPDDDYVFKVGEKGMEHTQQDSGGSYLQIMSSRLLTCVIGSMSPDFDMRLCECDRICMYSGLTLP